MIGSAIDLLFKEKNKQMKVGVYFVNMVERDENVACKRLSN